MGSSPIGWRSAAVALVALVAASCSNGRSTEETAQRAHEEFVHNAEALCNQAVADLEPLGSWYEAYGLSDENVQKFRTAVPIYHRWITGLQALTPPEEDASAVADFIGELQQLEEAGTRVLIAGVDGRPKGFDEAVEAFFGQMSSAIDAAHAAGFACP